MQYVEDDYDDQRCYCITLGVRGGREPSRVAAFSRVDLRAPCGKSCDGDRLPIVSIGPDAHGGGGTAYG